MGGLIELVQVMSLAQKLAHSKHAVNNAYYYFILVAVLFFFLQKAQGAASPWKTQNCMFGSRATLVGEGSLWRTIMST